MLCVDCFVSCCGLQRCVALCCYLLCVVFVLCRGVQLCVALCCVVLCRVVSCWVVG